MEIPHRTAGEFIASRRLVIYDMQLEVLYRRHSGDPTLNEMTAEIQRLIGRSLRAIVDLDALGEQMITVDCDVLDADGGTRTASITAAFIALVDAMKSIKGVDTSKAIRDSIAAVSVGIVDDKPVLDLDYEEDFAATVDMNVVMTGKGQFVEIQGTGEEATFSDAELASLLKLAKLGIRELTAFQKEKLGRNWPLKK